MEMAHRDTKYNTIQNKTRSREEKTTPRQDNKKQKILKTIRYIKLYQPPSKIIADLQFKNGKTSAKTAREYVKKCPEKKWYKIYATSKKSQPPHSRGIIQKFLLKWNTLKTFNKMEKASHKYPPPVKNIILGMCFARLNPLSRLSLRLHFEVLFLDKGGLVARALLIRSSGQSYFTNLFCSAQVLGKSI